ncbi:unnamed protein product, partial [Meganyctiphanes norvegica]
MSTMSSALTVIGLLLQSGSLLAKSGLYAGPYFVTPDPLNITVHQNTQAYLPCAVKQLSDKSVSWVRQKDSDILTVDRYTFVRDERFLVHVVPESGTWTLVIKYVQERDAGTYECQISTEPKMSKLVTLNVIVPRVSIAGGRDKYVRVGSAALLECKVEATVQPPDYVFWYRGDQGTGSRLLEHNHPRLAIREERQQLKEGAVGLSSILEVSDVTLSDAGNYTCLPSNLKAATALLHIIDGEHPEAMKTGVSTSSTPNWVAVLLAAALYNIYIYIFYRKPLNTYKNRNIY